MRFEYSRHCKTSGERALQRFFEILPGALSWLIIVGMTVLSFVKPLIAAAIMVAFVLYWVLRLLYMNVFLAISYVRLSIEKDTDWIKMIKDVDSCNTGKRPKKGNGHPGLKGALSNFIRERQFDRLLKSGMLPPASDDIYHLIILPVIKETREIIEPSIKSIARCKYPGQKVLFVIALEERANSQVKQDVIGLKAEYKNAFMDFLISEHPSDLPGEAKVKGANASYAAKEAAVYFQKHKIPYENVIVSCFDADTVADPQYFACLTYYFMITPLRTRASYQPIPVYYNNLWQVPSFARIIDIGTSFFQLVEATNPEKLVTFSSHSMSFKALVEVDFWPVDMISDDSAIFWKSFIHFDGNYQVVPIYTTVSMDIANGRNTLQTFVNIYKQKRRWAWGVENLPVVMRAFLKGKAISLYKRFIFSIRLFDSFISWATWSFLLAFITWLPTIFASREFSSTTMYYMAPRIKAVIASLSLFGLLVCMIISLLLLPAGVKHRFTRKVVHIFEWLAIPVVILALSAIPALDAQTRLMLGRYLEFQVTQKSRK